MVAAAAAVMKLRLNLLVHINDGRSDVYNCTFVFCYFNVGDGDPLCLVQSSPNVHLWFICALCFNIFMMFCFLFSAKCKYMSDWLFLICTLPVLPSTICFQKINISILSISIFVKQNLHCSFLLRFTACCSIIRTCYDLFDLHMDCI